MANHRLIKKKIILLLCILIEIDICAEENRVSGLRLNLRDPKSGEISARCEADIISEEEDPVGFLNIALRCCVVVNRVSIEVFCINRSAGIFRYLNFFNREVSIPVKMRSLNVVFNDSNIKSINASDCRLRFDKTIDFKIGEICFYGLNETIAVRNGALCFSNYGKVEVFFHYRGKRQRCEVIQLYPR